jgi:hypothetical protein
MRSIIIPEHGERPDHCNSSRVHRNNNLQTREPTRITRRAGARAQLYASHIHTHTHALTIECLLWAAAPSRCRPNTRAKLQRGSHAPEILKRKITTGHARKRGRPLRRTTTSCRGPTESGRYLRERVNKQAAAVCGKNQNSVNESAIKPLACDCGLYLRGVGRCGIWLSHREARPCFALEQR